jgi:cobaltochelatase CobS
MTPAVTFKDNETPMITTPHTLTPASPLFNIRSALHVPVLTLDDPHIPAIDPAYHFDTATTEAVLAGFLHGKHVMLQGFHGTGKSSHIEQVAARLCWPLIRINLDGYISRLDLIGRDVITLQDGKQITAFQEGMLPWALSRPCALLFDEYDAARPDVMFVLQRLLEAESALTLLDQNKVIIPHPEFRLFATANTVGLGDATGMYHGTNPINQGHMDRWPIVATLNYLAPTDEVRIVQAKVQGVSEQEIRQMVALAGLIRTAFANGDLASVMSPRAVIHFAENLRIFTNRERAFRYAFMNKCDASDYPFLAELYQRVFNEALAELAA